MNWEELVLTWIDNEENEMDELRKYTMAMKPAHAKNPGVLEAKIETPPTKWAVEVAGGDRVTVEAKHFDVDAGTLFFLDDVRARTAFRAFAPGTWLSVRKL